VVDATGDIASPAAGMLVYSITDGQPMLYSGSAWNNLCTAEPPLTNDSWFKVVGGIPIIPVMASDPGVSPSGSIYYSASTGMLRISNGSAWHNLDEMNAMTDKSGFSAGSNLVQIPVLSSEPSGAETGAIYINSGDNLLYYYDGSEWQQSCTAFITRWQTTSANEDIEISCYNTGTYDAEIDWGDGSDVTAVTSYGSYIHTYASAGDHDICITGTFPHPYFYDSATKNKLIAVVQWGDVEFESMVNTFRDCVNLNSLPDRPITGVSVVTDFTNTFRSCSSLISIPSGLFDNCIGATDFRYTFYSCSSLTSIPSGLFDNCTDVTSFQDIFYNCSSLQSIPAGLFDNCIAVTDFYGAFYYCSGITSIPSGLFDNCTGVTNFGYAFRNCGSLESIPDGLFDNCIAVTSFSRIFYSCGSLTSIPSGLFDNCTGVIDFGSAFSYCTSLQSLPTGLFDNCTAVTSFSRTFYGCSSLASIPLGLFDNCTVVTSFYRTFYSDTDLDGDAPELWNTHSSADGEDCFYNCTGLDNYSSIPSTWGGP
jgi:hypothetical protein